MQILLGTTTTTLCYSKWVRRLNLPWLCRFYFCSLLLFKYQSLYILFKLYISLSLSFFVLSHRHFSNLKALELHVIETVLRQFFWPFLFPTFFHSLYICTSHIYPSLSLSLCLPLFLYLLSLSNLKGLWQKLCVPKKLLWQEKSQLLWPFLPPSFSHSLSERSPFLYICSLSCFLYFFAFLYFCFSQIYFKFEETKTKTLRYRKSTKTERFLTPCAFLTLFLSLSRYLTLYICLPLFILPVLYNFLPSFISLSQWYLPQHLCT